MAGSALLSGIMVGSQALTTIGGAYSESNAIKSQSSYESQQLLFNSKLADLQSRSVERIGKEEAQKARSSTKQLIGKQRAAMAAQGIDIGSGTALDIQTETAELGALDALTIRNNAYRTAAGYRIEAIGYKGQSDFTQIAGKNNSRQTLISGGLNAANQVMSGYYNYKNK